MLTRQAADFACPHMAVRANPRVVQIPNYEENAGTCENFASRGLGNWMQHSPDPRDRCCGQVLGGSYHSSRAKESMEAPDMEPTIL